MFSPSRFAPMRPRSPAAKRAAQEQRVPGQTHVIEYEDEKGQWHTETAAGSDRPDTDVKESSPRR